MHNGYIPTSLTHAYPRPVPSYGYILNTIHIYYLHPELRIGDWQPDCRFGSGKGAGPL